MMRMFTITVKCGCMFRGDRLKELREERNMTQIELADILCIRNTSISRYETNEREPDSETLTNIAELFNVSTDYLLNRTPNRKGIPNKIDVKNTVPIPVVGVIRAGEPILAEQNIESYVLVTPEEARNGEYFYLRVTGDSMSNARIKESDLVYVRKQDTVDNRDIAVVIVDGENATLKRVIQNEDGIILQPESSNPAHAPKFYSYEQTSDFRIIGKVIHVKFNVNG
jgi:repressor LexA